MTTNQSMSETAREAHKRIWLQVLDEDGEPNDYDEGVTWCQDRIHDTDVEYIRADVALSTLPTMTYAQLSDALFLGVYNREVRRLGGDTSFTKVTESMRRDCHLAWQDAKTNAETMLATFPHLLTPEPLVKVGGES